MESFDHIVGKPKDVIVIYNQSDNEKETVSALCSPEATETLQEPDQGQI